MSIGSITFYKNACPNCGSTQISFIDEVDENGENKQDRRLKCDKCESIFSVDESRKAQVGDKSEL